MKGTLFSADFVFDSSDNARLLEINTDTALVLEAVENYLDFTDFGTILSDSSLDTLHIIYKPFHSFSPLIDFSVGGWSMQVSLENVEIPVNYTFSLGINNANSISKVSLKFIPEDELFEFLSKIL